MSNTEVVYGIATVDAKKFEQWLACSNKGLIYEMLESCYKGKRMREPGQAKIGPMLRIFANEPNLDAERRFVSFLFV